MSAFLPPLRLRQLLWMTAALLMVAAPHAGRLPWWLTLLTLTLVGWRLYLARCRLNLPHRALIATVVVGTSTGVFLHYGTLFGRDAGVGLLVVMLTLKLLETQTRRDAMLLAFLSCFLVITNFLYSQTIATALYMLACVWIITAGMIGVQYASAPGRPLDQLRTSGVMLVQSVPLMLVLFLLFPRVQGPLWGLPSDAHRATTGLSDTMTAGSLSSLTLSEAVAFRVSFKSPMPELKRMYWRGPVLVDYDGRTWRAAPFGFARPTYDTTYHPVEYTVTVEPHGKPWLFAIDLPGRLPPHSLATHDMQIISARAVTTRTRYDIVSFLDFAYGADEKPATLQRALALPPHFNPKTAALARELRKREPDDRALMQAVLTMFNREGFAYTLSPPLLGQHSVDEFLFGTKSGFCEHYSSAFAVLLRAAGIPARVVTGYLGGEVNPFGDYLIVRQADAHAWTEVWLKGEGWIRVDPTAAVSPARVEQGLSAAVESSHTLPLFMRSDSPLLRKLRLTWDSAANGWNQWVLGYSAERQRALLTRFGLDDTTWRTLAALLLVATAAVTLALGLFTLQRVRVRVRDPITRAYMVFCRKLHSAGLPRYASEGPLMYAERMARARPDLEPFVRRFLALYTRLRYGAEAPAAELQELQALARDFNPWAAQPRARRERVRPNANPA
ncbi:MAG: transglutaminase TgpA family protein [Burkholderiales bacterium]